MTNKEHLLETQGYYYLVTVTWKTNPKKVFTHEYGNEESATKAAKHWNAMPDCEATISKRGAFRKLMELGEK